MKFFLLTLIGDLEPLLSGPLPNERAILMAAREYREEEDPDGGDGLFGLVVDDHGNPEVYAFAGGMLTCDEADLEIPPSPDSGGPETADNQGNDRSLSALCAWNSGNGVTVEVVQLADGRVLGITGDSVVLYRDLDALQDGEALGDAGMISLA